jgi:hypothetical protein
LVLAALEKEPANRRIGLFGFFPDSFNIILIIKRSYSKVMKAGFVYSNELPTEDEFNPIAVI